MLSLSYSGTRRENHNLSLSCGRENRNLQSQLRFRLAVAEEGKIAQQSREQLQSLEKHWRSTGNEQTGQRGRRVSFWSWGDKVRNMEEDNPNTWVGQKGKNVQKRGRKRLKKVDKWGFQVAFNVAVAMAAIRDCDSRFTEPHRYRV